VALSPREIAGALVRWRQDPVAFCVEVLGFEPWSKQCELMRAVAKRPYVACRSGHKCGKTTALGALALWFIVCFPRSRVVMTAPAAPQIERGMWAELTRLYGVARDRGYPLGGTLNNTPYTGLRFADGRDVFGRSTNKKENFAGISAPNLLILVDEASGIEEEIWEAIYGNAAGGAKIVAISNPTQLSGRFYNIFHTSRDTWELVHISSEDTPNFHGGSVPGLATPQWAAMMKEEWGFPSAHYDVRVLGNFPSQADNAVIPFALVEQGLARGRLLEQVERGEGREQDLPANLRALLEPADALCVGVDVARFGDDTTCIAPARGLRLYRPIELHALDIVNVSGAAYDAARELARRGEVPSVRVDANGIGAGVYDNLRRREHVKAVEVNVSVKARDYKKYPRVRDELWFGFTDWLKRGGALPVWPRLAAELIAPVYEYDVSGRRVVESKKDIKERLGRSPDCADAACLAVGRVVARAGIAELRKHLRGRRM
jgi:phage terminase large subunit